MEMPRPAGAAVVASFPLHILAAGHAALALSPENIRFLPSPFGFSPAICTLLVLPIEPLDLLGGIDRAANARRGVLCAITRSTAARCVGLGTCAVEEAPEKRDTPRGIAARFRLVQQLLPHTA